MSSIRSNVTIAIYIAHAGREFGNAMKNPTESALEFPCSFPLKVFGKNADDFEEFVAAIVRRHVPQLTNGAISSRPSKSGNYLAVTITFMAESQEQLDALYQEISASERILMAL